MGGQCLHGESDPVDKVILPSFGVVTERSRSVAKVARQGSTVAHYCLKLAFLSLQAQRSNLPRQLVKECARSLRHFVPGSSKLQFSRENYV